MNNHVQEQFKKSYIFEDPNNPRLVKMLADYKLKEVIAPGTSELDQLFLLSTWVFNWIARFGKPTMQTEEAVTILENAHDNLFYCSHYVAVFVAAATGLGWQARAISQAIQETDYRGSYHNVVEVWSRQFNRWIFIDPTHNNVFTRDGIPLNCYEIGRDWFRHKGANLLIVMGQEKKEYTVKDFPLIVREFFHKDGQVGIMDKGMDKFAIHAWPPTNCYLKPDEKRTMERWDDWDAPIIINGFDNNWEDKWEELAPYYKNE